MFTLTKPKASFMEIITKSVWYGFIAGMISGMVKIGWEKILPPRTLARDATNPPQEMLQQMGFTYDQTHAYVYYSHDQKVFFTALIIHFGFSIVFAGLFVLLSQYWPTVGMGQGAIYGIVIWIAFHLIIMPLMGTTPAAWKLPFDEQFSEFFGHIIWAWSIAATVYYLIAKSKHGKLTNI
ncbi:YagU family protein [Eupransor demetentiae]|uniref:DUF1440 family (YagU) n=1 Tax=Eupransor demetentiae TaxID=3109584 RepID=A0ABM9N6F9_9LACO|nr:DUF1440 family (YagU) [Lactobacillaceae bacterium LMG 33000]